MVLGLKGLASKSVDGMLGNSQISTQGAAATAVTYTTSGAIAQADTVVDLNTGAAKIAMTMAGSFNVGRVVVITQVDAGTDGHTVTLGPSDGTFDGTNNTATFNEQYDILVLLCISPKRFLILKNIGVALSAV